MKLSSQLLGLGAVLALASSHANALVTTWDFSVTSLFTSATYNGGGGTNPGAGVGALSWGTSTGQGQSSLVVGNSPATGSVDTYTGVGVPNSSPFLGISTSLTHNNKPITGTSLTAATLTNTVVLDPAVPNNGALSPQIIPFDIKFVETPNSGVCAVSGSPTPCNDIFVLTGGLLNYQFNYDALDGDGLNTYFVNIFPITGGVLGVLENTACAAAGQANGCIGFSTPEGQSTTLAFGFTISANPLTVPEPDALALMGLGLFGLAAMRRRKYVSK